jgi:CDP-glycerol glycerophosphotransferase
MINKKSILFYAGNFNANTVTRLFLNLVNSIDFNQYNVALCVDMNAINKSTEREKEFNKLYKNIKIIPRTGRMEMSIEEKTILKNFESEKCFENEEIKNSYKKIYEDEYRRIFMDNYFDAIIHFEGYSLFWQRLFAYAPNSMVGKRSIYQHYDMDKIWKKKYPMLEFNFMLYKEFSYLISTSKNLCKINSQKLSKAFNLRENSFVFIGNIHNRKEVLAQSRLNLSQNNLFLNTKVFINMARLSKENGQEQIFRAFSKIFKEDSQTRLVFLGTGLLEQRLRVLIKEENLQGKVFLLGQRYNPSSYLQKADCLVDASIAIEDAFVVREAYLMKKPIIITNTGIHRIILKDRAGVFVENTEEGVFKGMLSFLNKNAKERKIFDYDAYNQNVLAMFYSYTMK